MQRAGWFVVATCAWLLMPATNTAHAAVEPSPTPASTAPTTIAPDKLDSPAATQIKKVPRDVINARAPRRFSQAEQREEIEAAKRNVDEIRVYADRDPEDVARSKSGFVQLRERMENDKPLTPAQIAQGALCFIGLCANYGPDGAPPEPARESTAKARREQSTTQQSRLFDTLR
jgi:hypothetical protein